MSLSITLRLKENKINVPILEQEMRKYGLKCIPHKISTGVVEFDLMDQIGAIMFFSDSMVYREYPHNVWDSILLAEEFQFKNIVDFDLAKEYPKLQWRNEVIFGIICDLLTAYPGDAIVIANFVEYFAIKDNMIYLDDSSTWVLDYIGDLVDAMEGLVYCKE